MSCEDLEGFSEIARKHATKPHNLGKPESYDSYGRITGSCGDTMAFWLSIKDGKVSQVSFITDGCGASLACGSMAVCLAEGRQIEEVLSLEQKDILQALKGLPSEYEHCALLAANTLKAACNDYISRNKEAGSRGDSCEGCQDSSCSARTAKADESREEFEERQRLQSKLCRIKHKIVVLSGKGGVGKSTMALNLAAGLMLSGRKVGLLDVDVHGPSIPTMLGLEKETLRASEEGLQPIELGDLKVMSIGFLLKSHDDAVIWRGPMKIGAIKQFLMDVAWGDLDYLIIDSPPGTGDEPLSVCQFIENLDGALLVSTPQKVAAVDVRKSVTFCRQLGVPVLGIVENMNGFACPKCGEITHILSSGGGRQVAEDMNLPFLGSLPIDPAVAEACDSGKAFIHHFASSPTAQIMHRIVKGIIDLENVSKVFASNKDISNDKEKKTMRIAVPLADGKLAMHFGHCAAFALLDVDAKEKKIIKREDLEAPPHEPGLLPKWLTERGANLIIAGGMGQRAQDLFAQNGIEVIVGAPVETPENLVLAYMAGNLLVGENACDH